jgi:transcriptional regulator of arginine metabolism
MSRKQQRQTQIRDLLARNEVRSQGEILALLETEGIRTTQATLSRDLRDLGIAKRGKGYELPSPGIDVAAQRRRLGGAVRGVITRVDRGGTLVVAHTKPGQAPALAGDLMRAHLHEVIGVIAGQDQVFVATQTSGQARGLAELLTR